MAAKFTKKTLFSKIISGFTAISFIFTSIPAGSFAQMDKLRPNVAKTGGRGEIIKEMRGLSGNEPITIEDSAIFGPNVKAIFNKNDKTGIWTLENFAVAGKEREKKDWNTRTLGNKGLDLGNLFSDQQAIQEFVKQNGDEVVAYWMMRNLLPTAVAKEKKLRADITLIPPLTIGEEDIKTTGHYHPALEDPNRLVSAKAVPGISNSFTEVYVVLDGEAIYYLQKVDKDGNVVDAVQIHAKKGDIVPIPSTYGHITINPSQDKALVMMNWVSDDFASTYGDILKFKGGAYYFVKDEEGKITAVKNPEYEKQGKTVAAIRQGNVDKELAAEIGLSTNKPVYNVVDPDRSGDLEKLWAFLSKPESSDSTKFDKILGRVPAAAAPVSTPVPVPAPIPAPVVAPVQGLPVQMPFVLPPIFVLDNEITLLSGANTGAHNVNHALLNKADGGLYNHSEPRGRLELAMLKMFKSALFDSRALVRAQKSEEEKAIKDKVKNEFIDFVKKMAGLDVSTLPEIEQNKVLAHLDKIYAMVFKTEDYQNREIELVARSLVNKIVNVQLKELIAQAKKNGYSIQQTVLCVGETKAQYLLDRTSKEVKGVKVFDKYLSENTKKIISQDLTEILEGINSKDAEQLIGLRIAYEPRWAINTGLTPSLQEIQETHEFIKDTLLALPKALVLEVDYGGSLNAKNAAEILALPDVDGGLIGGAAKTPEAISVVLDTAITYGQKKGKILNIGLNWKAEDQETGLKPLSEFEETFKDTDLSKVRVVISTPQVSVVKTRMAELRKEIANTSPAFLLASLNMAEVKETLASEAKSKEIIDGIVQKLESLPKKQKLELTRLEAMVVLGKVVKLKETEDFYRISRIVHRLSAEQLEALKGMARADLFKGQDMYRKLAIVLKPTNIFVSAGNAIIFAEGGFSSWLDAWEPGQNIVAIRTLSGSKALDVQAFVQQNFYSGGVFSRYQVGTAAELLKVGESIIVDGKKVDSIIVPADENIGRPEMKILYFGPEIKNKDAVEICRKLGLAPDVVAEYGPGKDEKGQKGGTFQALRIKEFIELGLPVACASPVNKDGIKVGLKEAGLNPKIAFTEALYSFNRNKVSALTWAVDTLSCTSNAMLSLIVAMNEGFGVESGSGETDHAETGSNAKFPESPLMGRSRAAEDVLRSMSIVQNIQPASTGADKNLAKIIPGLEGNFPITAKRVGVISGSAFTVTLNLKKAVEGDNPVGKVKEVLRNFAKNKSNGMVKFYEGIAGVANTPLDTNAIVGWSSVSIIDGFSIKVHKNRKTVVIGGYYDNQSAAPQQIVSKWAPWMVSARRAKEILSPAPIHIQTAEAATIPYMSSWGKNEYAGKSVLERLDLNVSGAGGKIKSYKKISENINTAVAPLENGAKTVVILSHNGRPDGKVDPDYSLGPIAQELEKALKAKGYNYPVKFHPESITEKGVKKGLKQELVMGGINIVEDTRYFKGEEGGDPEFAKQLADLVDNEIFIFDAFGAAERTGGSLDLVANYVEKVGLGLIMENEDKNLQLALNNLNGVVIGGGPKVSEKVPMLQKVIPNMKEGGFLMLGTGPIAPFLKVLHNIKIGTKANDKDVEHVQNIVALAKKHNVKLAMPVDFVVVNKDLTKPADGSDKSWLEVKKMPKDAKVYHVTLEQLKQGTFTDTESGDKLSSKNLFIYDIGKQSAEEFSNIVLQTPAGRWNVWNGAVGVSEMPQFETGSREVAKAYLLATLKEGKSAVVGSDTSAMSDQFKFTKEEIIAAAEKYGIKADLSNLGDVFSMSDKVSFVSTGGSSALAVMQGKLLLVMNGLQKAQAVINIANTLGVKAMELRNWLKSDKAGYLGVGGNPFDKYITNQKGKIDAVGNKAIIVGPSFFNGIGAANALLKLSELLSNNFKIGIYGNNAAGMKVLLGGNANIVTGNTLEEVVAGLGNSGVAANDLVLLKPEGEKVDAQIKQVVFAKKSAGTLALAKAVKEALNNELTDKLFAEFYQEIEAENVIPKQKDAAKNSMLAKLKDAAAFTSGDMKIAGQRAREVEEDAQKIGIFMQEVATKG